MRRSSRVQRRFSNIELFVCENMIPMRWKRNQYSCLRYGFSFVLDEDVLPNSQCLLGIGCMKPSKCEGHLQTIHTLILRHRNSIYSKASWSGNKVCAFCLKYTPRKDSMELRFAKETESSYRKSMLKSCTMEITKLILAGMQDSSKTYSIFKQNMNCIIKHKSEVIYREVTKQIQRMRQLDE
jgi:hypothetical protein